MIEKIKTLKPLPGIYIITCKANGKCYVGESLNLRLRVKKHLRSSDLIFHRALAKHGLGAFDIYTEYFPNFSKDDLLDLEDAVITRFDAMTPNGYNFRRKGSIGQTNHLLSEETKTKISKAHLGKKKKPFTEEHKANISKARRGAPKRFNSETHNKNISKAHLGMRGIYNAETFERRWLKPNEKLPNGWSYGMKRDRA